ncbi:MAG: tetratricopeptide repeat protein, partial [Planctomycetota bacterium]
MFGNPGIEALLLVTHLFLNIAANTPPQGEVQVNRAQHLLQQGQLLEAEKLCQMMLGQHPRDGEVMLLLGRVRFATAERLERAHRPRGELLAAYRFARTTLHHAEALGVRSGIGSLYHAVGYCYYMEGAYEKAILSFSRALEAGVTAPSIRILRGICYSRLNRLEAAREDLSAAVELLPQDYHAHMEYAEVLARQGRTANARQVLWSFYRQSSDPLDAPGRYRILYRIFLHALHDNDVEAALAPMLEAEKVFPENPKVHLELGALYYRKGQLEPADAEFLKSLSGSTSLDKPSHARALYHRGLIAHHQGDHHRALKLFDESRVLSPTHAPTLQQLGTTLRRLGQHERAQQVLDRFRQVVAVENEIQRLRKLTLNQPRNGGARGQLIQALLKLKRLDEASQELQDFRNYRPDEGSVQQLENLIREAQQKQRIQNKAGEKSSSAGRLFNLPPLSLLLFLNHFQLPGV